MGYMERVGAKRRAMKKVLLEISANEEGAIEVSGIINDKVKALGLLEVAKHLVIEYRPKAGAVAHPSELVVPGSAPGLAILNAAARANGRS